jgi:DNA-binding CsgD family transcriptional regulator
VLTDTGPAEISVPRDRDASFEPRIVAKRQRRLTGGRDGDLPERQPDCETLILTGLSQPGNLLRALRAHVRGFVVKDAPADKLADGIRRIAAGQRVIDPELVSVALDTGESPLTSREADVLREGAAGLPTDQIGTRLSLSPATVRNYLSSAISKTGGQNRIDAIRIARSTGRAGSRPSGLRGTIAVSVIACPSASRLSCGSSSGHLTYTAGRTRPPPPVIGTWSSGLSALPAAPDPAQNLSEGGRVRGRRRQAMTSATAGPASNSCLSPG